MKRVRVDRPSEGETERERRPHVAYALRALLDACQQAHESACDVWEYAVEIQEFRSVNVPVNMLRWLLDCSYVKHGYEETGPRSRTRKFKKFKTHAFTNRSCFVLTDSGLAFARDALHGSRPVQPREGVAGAGANELRRRQTPRWDTSGRVRMLWLGGIVVKVFHRSAPDQRAILDAFEAQGWPQEIVDPLPELRGKSSKTRHKDTIKHLNERQANPVLHFYSAAGGDRIGWTAIVK